MASCSANDWKLVLALSEAGPVDRGHNVVVGGSGLGFSAGKVFIIHWDTLVVGGFS